MIVKCIGAYDKGYRKNGVYRVADRRGRNNRIEYKILSDDCEFWWVGAKYFEEVI